MRNKKGYTILELITVVVIIGILAVVSLPAFQNLRKGSRLKASARRVTSALRYARRMAITMNSVYSVSFNKANRTFGVIDGSSGSDTMEKRFTLDETISFDSSGDPINFNSNGTTTDVTDDMISFKANGSMSNSNGTIWIKSIDGSYFHMSVINTSGRVRIYSGAKH